MTTKPKRRRKHSKLHRLIWGLGGIVLLLCLILLLIPESKGYGEFLDALGFRESSDDYTKVNSYGYVGRYQMGGMALEEAGFKNADGEWTELANSYGIYSREDFLNSPEGQEQAIRAYHKTVCKYIRFYGLEKYIGKTYCGVKVTRSGLLAACHLVGVGSMKKALASGEVVRDGFGTPATEYLELFGDYNINEVWRN